MSNGADEASGGTDTQDDELLADLFDDCLQAILDGREPDLDRLRRERPDLLPRIEQTWALACSVAGRREPSRPVLGGYEILRELGHGGMGTVYLARHEILQREVAIKVLPHSLALSPHARQRFLDEARALARLRHEHVVHVHRIVDHAEMLAFEMEYIEGPSLRDLVAGLRQHPKPRAIQSLAEVLAVPVEALGTRNPVEWFVRLGIKMARALAEVHRHGLVHRDVKPSNILLRRNGEPVLADFGLAREGEAGGTRATFAGTPVYAAPERLRTGDADLDARADVYSLAISLYEALTLTPPFAGTSSDAVLRRIEAGRLPALRQLAPHVARDLETVIGKAMEPDRRHRYPTADAFADDLERLLALQPIQARPAGPARRAWKFLRRHQRLAVAAACGAVLVGSAAGLLVAQADAQAAARERAAAERHAARERLLCPENLYLSWSPTMSGVGQQALYLASRQAARLAELEGALRHYDAAIAAMPEDAGLRTEGAAVRAIADRLRNRHDAAEPPVDLPPLTAHLATAAEGEPVDDAEFRRLLARASARDRFTAGLVAFLRGASRCGEACWQGLDADPADQAFRDACTALQPIGEGSYERAYPRLFLATRVFPAASALGYAMAEAAIAAGDLDLAEQWIGAIPTSQGSMVAQARRRLLETDVLAARGQYEDARRGYAELRAADASDPEPLLRLAALALRQGAMREAESIHREVRRRWPDLATPRLQSARFALQRRNLAEYLDAARHVLALDLDREPRRRVLQFAEILRLGGLHELHAELCAAIGHPPGALRSDDAVPLGAWLRPGHQRGLVQALRLLQTFDRHLAAVRHGESRPVAAALRAGWHTVASVPELAKLCGWPAYTAVLAGLPLGTEAATQWISPRLLGYQRALGDRLRRIDARTLFERALPDQTVAYGHVLLRVPDADGDTLEDLCVAAPPAGTRGGGYLEWRRLADGSLQRTWSHDDDSQSFGLAVVALGDVDGDLCTDLLVGAPMARRNTYASAAVSLRSGRGGDELWRLDDDTPSFGAALASLGDLDGDGIADAAVGIPPMTLSPADRGRVLVLSGRTGRPLFEVTADRGGVWFGGAVADAGDTNGDGFVDLLVGGNFGRTPGLVALFDGRNGALLSTLADADASTDFGRSVLGIGDVDGDGLADIAIGAPGSSSAGRLPGEVHVVSGRTGRTLYQLRGDSAGDAFGSVLCRLPWYRRDRRPALAVAARSGGPLGTGYVRVFDVGSGAPLQTLSNSVGRVGAALVDLGDLEGDGLRDLGILVLRPSAAFVMVASWAQVAGVAQRR
ncbi:MAG: protein kinase [Planctomycetes bacterium]|nr:protein kinase [Planctomycetota bacterium]